MVSRAASTVNFAERLGERGKILSGTRIKSGLEVL
jgi:hypothetical protein